MGTDPDKYDAWHDAQPIEYWQGGAPVPKIPKVMCERGVTLFLRVEPIEESEYAQGPGVSNGDEVEVIKTDEGATATGFILIDHTYRGRSTQRGYIRVGNLCNF